MNGAAVAPCDVELASTRDFGKWFVVVISMENFVHGLTGHGDAVAL